MEDFEAGGPFPPLELCLDRVRQSSVLVVIVARRYGWVPSNDWPDLPSHQHSKSITWLECLEAEERGIEIIPLLLAEDAEWPKDGEENSPGLPEFVRWLKKHHAVRYFEDIESFGDLLTRALDRWKNEPPVRPGAYLAWIDEFASQVPVTPRGPAPVELSLIPWRAFSMGRALHIEDEVSLHHVLVSGEPGSGKSMLLKRYARKLARERMQNQAVRFPLFFNGGELWDHVVRCHERNERHTPARRDSPGWVSHYLARLSEDKGAPLPDSYCRRMLVYGQCTLLLDGLDQGDPLGLAALLGEVARAHPKVQIVATSRPWAIQHRPELRLFQRLELAALNNQSIRELLGKWCALAHPGRDDIAQREAKCIYRAILASPGLRRQIRNPLLLSAVVGEYLRRGAVPAKRVEVYRHLVEQLVPEQEGSPKPRTHGPVTIVQELAWKMQSAHTPLISVSSRRGGEFISGLLEASVERAEQRLIELATSSGLVQLMGGRLTFWHPTIAEFLAARRLAYMSSGERRQALEDVGEAIATGAWRPVLLFLGQLLEDEPADVEDLFFWLIQASLSGGSPTSRPTYVGALVDLGRELKELPKSLVDSYQRLLGPYEAVFRSRKLTGFDIRTRVEIAHALSDRILESQETQWITIPAGEFWVGAQRTDPGRPRYDSDCFPVETPAHPVYLSTYQISRDPVTVAQFVNFTEDDGYRRQEFWSAGQFPGRPKLAPLRWEEQMEVRNRPVSGVSWFEAMAYCRWANSTLPSEAQWERAAAGPNGYRFPWGNERPDGLRANFGGQLGGVTPVGLFPEWASEEGLHEMAGNVWEWVLDGFGKHAASESVPRDPVGGQGSDMRVLKGGCYQSDERLLRTSERIRAHPDRRYTNFGVTGFRLARKV